MLVADGVFPSNEARGYVLRRIIRRAVRYAYLLGTDKLVLPELAEVAVDVMGNAYPDVARQRDFIVGVLGKEEENFRHTLRNGLSILERELGRRDTRRTAVLSGSTAFALHDTYGFPLELTQEIASERGVTVDLAGFETEMAEQRQRAKAARGVHREHANVDAYRRIVEQHGVTTFLGYVADNAVARVLDVLDVPDSDGDGELVEIFLDQTPFYAESGGQVGDTGSISTETGTAEVVDTTFALPNLRRHTARIVAGTITPGQAAAAAIDVDRRNSIRRNHTATHLVHHALREVLGEHVKQAGSLVAPDRLRFDFSHYAPLSADEITRIETLANDETLANTPVRAFETSKAGGRGPRRHRLLRREVRRRRPRPRGGQLDRALRRHTRQRHRRHRHDQDRQRRLDRVQPAAHRGGDRHGAVALLQRDEHDLGEIAQLVGTPGDATGGVRRKLDELRAAQRREQAAARQARPRPGERARRRGCRRCRHPPCRRTVAERPPRAGDRRPQRPRRRHRRARRQDADGRRVACRGGHARFAVRGGRPDPRRGEGCGRRWWWQGRRRHSRRQGPGRHRPGAGTRPRGGPSRSRRARRARRRRQLVRVLALDLGSKRIGVAVSDLTGTVASPLTVLERSKSRRHDHERIAALVREEEAELVVIGLPISLSGAEGPAARAARTEAKALATLVDVPIETFDERLTTVTAERALAEAGVRGRLAARWSTRSPPPSSCRRSSTDAPGAGE